MKEIVTRYVVQQLKSFRVNFIRSGVPRNEDPVHDYRVALKRIDAILKFLAYFQKSGHLRNIYRIAYLQDFFIAGGILREIHINIRLLREFEKELSMHFTVLRQYLRKEQSNAFKKLQRSSSKYSYRRISYFKTVLQGSLKALSNKELLHQIDEFIETKISQIEALILDQDVESNLHKIRKYVKSIKYMLEMAGIQKRTFGKLNFTAEKITLLEDRIGDWHDMFVFKRLITRVNEKMKYRDNHFGYPEDLLSTVDEKYRETYEATVQFIYEAFKINQPETRLS